MKKFLVLYCMPHAGLEGWMAKPEEERKAMEDTMKAEWDTWTAAHKDAVLETAGAGAVTIVDQNGAKDSHNDIMMYSLVQAESKEAATALFVGHPHFGIPEATIQIMPAKVMTGMS